MKIGKYGQLIPKADKAQGRVLQIFLNTDLRCAHNGLALIAEKADISTNSLEPGQFVIFLNSKKDQMKVFAANHIVAHYKSPHGRIELGMLVEIPKAFKGNGFNFNDALKSALEKHLAKKRRGGPERTDLA